LGTPVAQRRSSKKKDLRLVVSGADHCVRKKHIVGLVEGKETVREGNTCAKKMVFGGC